MSKAILISILPEHVAGILSGIKVFEYRKVMPKQNISHLVLYCTAPTKRVVAVAEVAGRLVGTASKIWADTAYGSGITRKFYKDYFSGHENARAFELGNVYELSKPLELSTLTSCKVAPQSFCYLNSRDTNFILKKMESIPVVLPSFIFVGGIHGVGKTAICRKAFAPIGYRCMTASSLIASYGGRINNNKQVDDLSGNQTTLIKRLAEEKQRHCRLLLDGHFTLINNQGQIEPVDINVFREMNLDQLILIKGDPDVIFRRLILRDKQPWNTSLITEFQEAEEQYANIVAKYIGKKLLIINNEMMPGNIARQIKKNLQ